MLVELLTSEELSTITDDIEALSTRVDEYLESDLDDVPSRIISGARVLGAMGEIAEMYDQIKRRIAKEERACRVEESSTTKK